jgi:3'-phosphoadenosine 5'-phosphosulfate sulfotransferase (PAPS reductase)/FAD synthetase
LKQKPNLVDYDFFIIAFSGGKDSIASVLWLLEQGVPKDRIELWHHLVDGKEGSTLMDWPCTEDYCQKFADSFGLKIKFSWKVGGFEREMLRREQRTAPTKFMDDDDNLIECGGLNGKLGTREKFPQVSADLRVRWCSAYLKIDVCTSAINNQARFVGKKTLIISGERAEESPGRAKYLEFQPDRADRRNGARIKRHVDRLRPVHKWTEKQVWKIIEKYMVNPHPAYRLGWSRLSCISCIFGNSDQWASIHHIKPNHTDKISAYEKRFGLTIHREKSISERIEAGTPYPDMDQELVAIGLSNEYTEPLIVPVWQMPAGAFKESIGPS